MATLSNSFLISPQKDSLPCDNLPPPPSSQKNSRHFWAFPIVRLIITDM